MERPADAFVDLPLPTSYGHPGHFRGQANITDVVAAPEQLVAVGYVGLPGSWTAMDWVSADGRDWRVSSIDSADPSFARSVAVSPDGLFVAVGWTRDRAAAWTSPDGRNWTRADPPGDRSDPDRMTAIVASGRGLVAGGSAGPEGGDRRARFWTSADGMTWRRAADSAELDDAEAVNILALDHGFVALGQLGTAFSSTGSVAWTSTDGSDWVRIDDPALQTGLVRAAAVGRDGTLLAVGTDLDHREAVVWLSSDGVRWERLQKDESRLFKGQKIRMSDVVATNGGFVAVGDQSSIQRPTGLSWVSSDGRSWTKAPLQASLAHAEVLTVANAGDYLVSLGTFGAPDNFIPSAWISPTPEG